MITATRKPQQTVSRRQIIRSGLLWLVFLAPFFFLTYGQVNTYTATLGQVPSIVFLGKPIFHFSLGLSFPIGALTFLWVIFIYLHNP